MIILNFKGLKYQYNILVKWNSILFKSYIRKNFIENLQIVFNNMIINIRLFQYTISITIYNPDIYYIRIIIIYNSIPECYSAICNLYNIVIELIN